MKKIFLAVLILLCSNLFAQDWNEVEHKRNNHKKEKFKRDYFTVGLYTGSYIGKGSAIEANDYMNSISAEIEYVKFSDLSIYVRGLYRFSKYTTNYSINNVSYSQVEPAYKLAVGFGGRYFARKNGNVKPYLQIGLNQETEYIKHYFWGNSFTFRYFINIGLGFNVKISRKFTFDMKYDLNKSLDKDVYYSFNGFSVLAGIKYNL